MWKGKLEIPYTPTKYRNRYKYKLDKKKTGVRITYFRKLHNLKQTKFAQLLNVSRTHISLIKYGKTLPSLTLLYNTSQVFCISLADLLKE